MKIAIIGSGIAGNICAASLNAHQPTRDVTLFEKNARPGGHSATVDIDYDGTPLSVDTGFIVYNTLNYPGLTKLFNYLGVETRTSNMSFALSLDDGSFEWCGREQHVLSGLFAQRRNLFNLKFYRLLYEMVRFSRVALRDFAANRLGLENLGDYLDKHHFSQTLRDYYLAPMAGAIWSTPVDKILDFPAQSFVQFFNNHRLLHAKRPQWRTVHHGSRHYVTKLLAPLAGRVRTGVEIKSVARAGNKLAVSDHNGNTQLFDKVVLATHAPQAQEILSAEFASQRALLKNFRTLPNLVYLHCDETLMPKRKAAWGAWNVLAETRMSKAQEKSLCVTYWMNLLQNIDPAKPLFVTLNPPTPPAQDKIFGVYQYDHPQYDAASITAQPKLDALQGMDGLYFCGAWTGFGFHEDGLQSGLAIAKLLGAQPVYESRPFTKTLAEAAE